MHETNVKNENGSFSLNVIPSQNYKEFECQLCGKVMLNLNELEEHSSKNHRVYPATPKFPNKPDIDETCGNCNVNFTKMDYTARAAEVLKEHKAMCIREIQCDLCNFRVNKNSEIVKHMESMHGQSFSPEPN